VSPAPETAPDTGGPAHGGVRLNPVPYAEWDEVTKDALLAHLRRPERYLSGSPDAPPIPVVLELFAHHVALGDCFMAFTDMLAGDAACLDPAWRELAILRVSWRSGSGYEWAQHARMAREAGLSEDEVAAVPEGPDADVWSPTQRALVAAVDEIVDDSCVSGATWAALAAVLAPDQLLELLFVIGGYMALAGVLNSIGLRGEAPSELVTRPAEPGASQ
jgi:4-carboxymuconolactone decarboxylase